MKDSNGIYVEGKWHQVALTTDYQSRNSKA